MGLTHTQVMAPGLAQFKGQGFVTSEGCDVARVSYLKMDRESDGTTVILSARKVGGVPTWREVFRGATEKGKDAWANITEEPVRRFSTAKGGAK